MISLSSEPICSHFNSQSLAFTYTLQPNRLSFSVNDLYTLLRYYALSFCHSRDNKTIMGLGKSRKINVNLKSTSMCAPKSMARRELGGAIWAIIINVFLVRKILHEDDET